MSTTTGSLRLTIPDNWYDLSVADESAENALARRLWDACVEAGIEEETAGQFTEEVRRSVRHARRNGVLHAAGVFEIYEDGPLTATVVAAMVTPPGNADLLTALTENKSGVDTWTRVSTVRIEGVGTAARVHGIQDVVMDDVTIRCAVMHTLIRIPGRTDVLVITGTSPNIAEADDLFELFGMITGTVSFR
ncbi:hypothetical protein JNUCC0626_46710 [Lentzea sp. JNUCC 0626]|uniref:hypothetical protein n=1 Tax=Lentzea sp. JNUCC 0626 TaxID=3367513 RepID=UPI0037499604